MRRSHALRFSAALASTSLLLTACGSAESDDEGSVGTSAAGSDLAAEAGSTEVDGPSPRLVLADADSGHVSVVDLVSEDTLATFDLENPTTLTTVNDRYVYAVDDAGNAVHALEPGSWTIEHGDHSHSYTKNPAELGTLEGTKPAHVVAGDRKVAVFFDGEGKADITEFDSLSDGSAEPDLTVQADAPHHGIVIPTADHLLVSSSSDRLELRSEEGELVRTIGTPCPHVHGHATYGNSVVTACNDGLLLVSKNGGDWTSEKVAYPEGITEQNRPTRFRQQDSVPVVVGAANSDASGAFLAFDSNSRAWTRIDTADHVIDVNLSGDGTTAFAVLADGTFRVYDIATASESASAPALTGPVDAGDTTAPTPQVLVSGKRAYVTDPAGRRVQEVDYRDDARIARTLDTEFAVASAGVVGE